MITRLLPILFKQRWWRHALLACAAVLVLISAAVPLGAAGRFAVGMQATGTVFVPLIVVPAPSKSYYVDCTAGNDSNSGTAESAAWRSLARARTAPLAP